MAQTGEAVPETTIAGVVTASDPSGAITVALDGRGRIEAVRVVPGWRRRVPPEDFVSAVGEALVAGLDRLLDAQLSGAVTAGPTMLPPGGLPDGDLPHLLREWERQVYEFASRTVTTRSPAGHVTVVTRAATLAELVVDLRWLEAAQPEAIGGEVSQTLRSAYQEADRMAPWSAPEGQAPVGPGAG